jgi:hypothetical protein
MIPNVQNLIIYTCHWKPQASPTGKVVRKPIDALAVSAVKLQSQTPEMVAALSPEGIAWNELKHHDAELAT